MRVGGVQLGPFEGNAETNMDKLLGYINEAEESKIDILCFPELCMSPYFPKFDQGKEEQWFSEVDHAIIKKVIASTHDKNLTLIFPFAERSAEGDFNSAIIIKNSEILGKYRKVHLPILKTGPLFDNYEEKLFQEGNLGFPIFQIGKTRFGIQICFDRHFPEGFRILALKGSKIVFLPTNSAGFNSDPLRIEMWEKLIQVRAYENNMFIIAVNKVGLEEGWDFMGNSMIVNPQGQILKRLNQEEGLFSYNVDDKELQRDSSLLNKRRPSLYESLVEHPFS